MGDGSSAARARRGGWPPAPGWPAPQPPPTAGQAGTLGDGRRSGRWTVTSG
ncbi:EspF repeat-containing protein [Kitasatospora sp. NPDC058218]|uniref:EspF repeat-containing protein n=1 Tax=Kitasatospora sp. NPDC058218 TaxID=3346385 RepID=UPI0036DE0356